MNDIDNFKHIPCYVFRDECKKNKCVISVNAVDLEDCVKPLFNQLCAKNFLEKIESQIVEIMEQQFLQSMEQQQEMEFPLQIDEFELNVIISNKLPFWIKFLRRRLEAVTTYDKNLLKIQCVIQKEASEPKYSRVFNLCTSTLILTQPTTIFHQHKHKSIASDVFAN